MKSFSQVAICAALVVGFGIWSGSALGDEPAIGHKKTAWESKSFKRVRKQAMKFGDDYRKFIGTNKTEREVVRTAIAMAKRKGFKNLFGKKRPAVKAGSKLYAVVHNKLVAFVIVGKKPLSDGVHIVAAHIDAVRIDLKQNPLYADANMAMLETHYYGGIKSYQWLSLPLELRGIVVKKNGKTIDVSIGDKENEPVLVIPDIAMHMSRRVDRREGEELPGESLDPILSTTPAEGVTGDPFAAHAAALLKSEYGIDLDDLASAELELVPATNPRDVGIDRALVGGYGQDDRACAYAALRAILSAAAPQHTAIVVLADKEEIGSNGNTGAKSNFIRRVVAELLEGSDKAATELAVDRVFSQSLVFSADVTGAVNPHYKELYEKKNATFIGSGVSWDQTAVHAEVMAYVRRLFDDAGVTHQASEWGKSRGSKGEGGTLLPFFTQHGMNGLNVSIPLLSMHSPFELISKADLYEAYRAYRVFLED